MKKFLMIFLFLPALLHAEEKTATTVGPVEKEVITLDDPIPQEFKGQKILIQDKNGNPAGEFDRTKWRIVPRDKKVVYRQTKTVECTKTADERKPVTPAYVPVFKRHTLGLGIGYGKTGLETKAEQDKDLEVRQKSGAIFGAQYTYHWDEEWSFSGMVTSNSSVLAFANYSFNL